MTAPAIDGVDRALPRYRQHAHQTAILRNTPTPGTPTIAAKPSTPREAPDRQQVIGIPLFIQRTPPWRRQDWAQPQTPPTSEATA